MRRRESFGRGANTTDDEAGDSYALKLEHETDLAWMVSEGGFDSPTISLPKSCCSLEKPKPPVGGVLHLWVPDWLAESKGLV